MDGASWDKAAEDYSKVVKKTVAQGMGKPLLHGLAASNKAWPFAEAKGILDDGCGSGNAFEALLSVHAQDIPSTARLYASDISPAMIKAITAKRDEHIQDPHWKRLSIHVWDAAKLEGLEDGSLSHLFANFVFFFMPNPLAALQESHRVLTKDHDGGVLMFTSWLSAFFEPFWDLARKIKPDIKDPPVDPNWRSADGVANDVETHGFKIVDRHEMDCSFPFDGADNFLNLWSNPALSSYHSQMTEDQKEQWKTAIREYINEKFGDEPFDLINHGLIITARKI